MKSIRYLLGFYLSPKVKFAIKTSLSILIVYIISFSLGWQSPITAAITIALIASMDNLNDSLTKGLYRTLGTLLGAIIGIELLILFPQERLLYLISASISVTFFFYLARIYRGDTTIFFLTGMTIILVFQTGQIDGVFLYGINRTFMTILGIGVYTIVSLLLWPKGSQKKFNDNISKLKNLQLKLFNSRDTKIITQLINQERTIIGMSYDSLETNMNYNEYIKLKETLSDIDKELILYINDTTHLSKRNLEKYIIKPYKKEIEEIINMINSNEYLPEAFIEHKSIEIEHLTTLEQARIQTTIKHLKELHQRLYKLSQLYIKIDSFNIDFSNNRTKSKFNIYDTQALKASFGTFLIFWVSTAFWIYLNPPLGFYVVVLATSFSFITLFTPIKPSLLIMAYSLSFITSLISFIFILPHLSTMWEFGLYLWIFGFLIFYFVDLQATVFFIIGLSTLNISNDISYSFITFMLFWSMFYIFLFILLIFHYIPFSNRIEDMYLEEYKRFFNTLYNAISKPHTISKKSFHILHIQEQMSIWAMLIDTKYFDKIDKNALNKLIQNSQYLAYMFIIYGEIVSTNRDNQIILNFDRHLQDEIKKILKALSSNQLITIDNNIDNTLESRLNIYLKEKKSENDMIAFLEYINIQKDIYHILNNSLIQSYKINLNSLKESKF